MNPFDLIHAFARYVADTSGIHIVGAYVVVGLVALGVLRFVTRSFLTFRVEHAKTHKDPVRKVVAWVLLLVLTFGLLALIRGTLPPGSPL